MILLFLRFEIVFIIKFKTKSCLFMVFDNKSKSKEYLVHRLFGVDSSCKFGKSNKPNRQMRNINENDLHILHTLKKKNLINNGSKLLKTLQTTNDSAHEGVSAHSMSQKTSSCTKIDRCDIRKKSTRSLSKVASQREQDNPAQVLKNVYTKEALIKRFVDDFDTLDKDMHFEFSVSQSVLD
jgi:hypothetical protein